MSVVYDKILGRLKEDSKAGDMLKAVYDVNDNGIIDQAETARSVGGKSAAEIAAAVEASADIPKPGVDGGFAPLSGGKIPSQYLNINASTHVVADIAARDALNPAQDGERAFVRDATGDPTVESGAAEYIRDGSQWFKIAEAESLDLILDWENLVNKPATFPPAAHNHAIADVGNLSTQLAALAPLSALINPGISNVYENIPVGPTRTYKTLQAAYYYMMTKNMGGKGFQILLDPGQYAGTTFLRSTVLITSADINNQAEITGTLGFQSCNYVELHQLNISGEIYITNPGTSIIHDLAIKTTGNTGISVLQGAYARIARVTIDKDGTASNSDKGIWAWNGVTISISDVTIAGWTYGMIVNGARVSFAGSISRSAYMGIYADNGAYVTADLANAVFTDNARDLSPAANTPGNYNSYIKRV